MIKSASEILYFVQKFADNAHGQQLRKYTGERYILHPVRVMEMTREFHHDICVHAAALLHDVIEDTAVTIDQLENELLNVMGASEVRRVILLVAELTDIFIKENYPRLNRKKRKEKEARRLSGISSDAQSIKYADIIDNVKDIISHDIEFAKVYVLETKNMLQVMSAGNSALRQRAVKLVEQCLYQLQMQPAIC